MNSGLVFSQSHETIPGLSALAESDIRQSAIAFVNASTSPGLEGATLELDQENRQSNHWRSSLGFNAEFVLRDHIFNGYWGLAIVGGKLEDEIDFIADNGQPVQLHLERQVVALRGSLGLSFPIDEHFKLRTYLSLIPSDLRSNGSFDNLPDQDASLLFNTSAQMLSTAGTIDAIYSRWYGDYQLELKARYNLIYTDSLSDDNPILDTHDWNDTAKLEAKFIGPTRLKTIGRPWQWHTYANYTDFLSNSDLALGFTELIEVGAGLDWQMNIKPLDWFGWKSLGIRFGFIFGEDVEGYNFGLTAE